MLLASLLAHLLLEAHFLRVQAHLLQHSLAMPLQMVIAVTFVIDGARAIVWRETLEHRQEKDESGQALVRYVQLHRQCSEEAAYERLAAFVKKYVPLDDQSFIEDVLAQEKQILLALAQELLIPDPDAIDEI